MWERGKEKKEVRKDSTIFTEGNPIYLQLYELLKSDIISGLYRAGSRFPSKRVICDRFGVSPVTTEHALGLLCDEGYLNARERSGFFVAFSAGEFFIGTTHSQSLTPQSGSALHSQAELLQSGPAPYSQSLSLQSGPASAPHSLPAPQFPFPAYSRIMRRVISEYDRALLDRVPGQGLELLRKALCDYLARSRGIRVTPDRIVIGAGSEYLYGLLVQFFGSDAGYAIETPSYIQIEKVYRSLGANPALLPLGSNGIKSEALAACDAHVLHITPYRSYPSGITTSASKKHEYLRWAAASGRFIIEDDFESEFSPSSKPEETLFGLSDRDNVFYLNSFTRTIAPSIRIGYLILPQQAVDGFMQKLGFYSCTVSAFEQYVLTEFISSGEFERHLNRVRRKVRGNS